jgi:hypothetical protein
MPGKRAVATSIKAERMSASVHTVGTPPTNSFTEAREDLEDKNIWVMVPQMVHHKHALVSCICCVQIDKDSLNDGVVPVMLAVDGWSRCHTDLLRFL